MSDTTVSRIQAIRRISRVLQPVKSILRSPHEAVGLIASHNVTAHCDVPEKACSLRDGYALRTEDIEKSSAMSPVRLAVTQVVRAESLETEPVISGTAARVLTGGMVPEGADCVLAEEDVEYVSDEEGEGVLVRTPVRSGWFVRPAGGEIKRESIILRAGEIVTPQAAAVMIRTRVNGIHIRPHPEARVIAMGSELSDPTGQCEDSGTGRFPADNLVLTAGLLKQSGVDVVESGVLPDIKDRVVETLSAVDLPDIVITTGGTGRSERDFARISAQDAGFEILFNRVDIRPGRNMFAARRGDTLLFGLPGPPSAVFACYHAVVLPIIRNLCGVADTAPLLASMESGVSARPEGEWVALCRLEHKEGMLSARSLSGKDVLPMHAMGLANGVILLNGGDSILPGGTAEVVTTCPGLR